MSLSSTDPLEDGTAITEPSYPGYQRMAVSFSVPAPMEAGIGMQNINQITFAKAQTAQGTVTFATLHDSLSGGNMLAYKTLNTPKTIQAESSPTLLVGESRWWFSGNASVAWMTQMLNVFRGVTIPAMNGFLTLFNGNPESGGAELVGGGFTRKLVTFGSPVAQAGGQTTISNTAIVAFDSASVSLGNFDFVALMDAASGGRLLVPRQIAQATYAAGDVYRFAVGDYILSMN